jgi:hypothetical protein
MNISLLIDKKHILEYVGNWFTGADELKIDGKTIFKNPKRSDLSRYSDAGSYNRYEFVISGNSLGNNDIQIVFEINKPYFYADKLPFTYKVYANGKVIHEQTGF